MGKWGGLQPALVDLDANSSITELGTHIAQQLCHNIIVGRGPGQTNG